MSLDIISIRSNASLLRTETWLRLPPPNSRGDRATKLSAAYHTTARSASSPDDGWRRGRASKSAGVKIILWLPLFFSLLSASGWHNNREMVVTLTYVLYVLGTGYLFFSCSLASPHKSIITQHSLPCQKPISASRMSSTSRWKPRHWTNISIENVYVSPS